MASKMDNTWLDELLSEELPVQPQTFNLRLIYLEELISRSALPEHMKVNLEQSIDIFTNEELNMLHSYLMHNMPCPIDNGLYYSQEDIANKLAQLK